MKIFYVILPALIFFQASLFAARDHAPIHGPRESLVSYDRALNKIGFDREDYTHHEAAAEKYKDKYFRDKKTSQITLKKTLNYLKKIVNEYQINKKRVYETEFIEVLDISKSHVNKANKKALKSDINNNILDPYNLYLLPKLASMIKAIKAGKDNELVEGLLDDFIRGYIPYYNPNPFNCVFRTKVNIFGALYRIVRFPQYKKNTKKIQANNLLIENIQQEKDINKILEVNRKIGDFLTHQEITILLANNYDISKLNPGKSPLWHPQSKLAKKSMYDKDPIYYPSPETKKTFDHVMLGGANSDKIKLIYQDQNGQERDVKLKIGDEVHLELASSALMRLIGFNTDSMIYADKVTFFLKDKTFDNFEAEIRQKFGQQANVRYNYERGIAADGEKYITWRDTLFEARPDSEIRIAPLDIASWDLQNRREYRGVALAVAWLGINDLKADNTKVLLVKRGGKWLPEHRIHDLGVSLGATLTLTGPDSVLSLPAPYGKVNQFETEFIKRKKGGVKIIWNDFAYQYRQYNSSTYYDLKWMARKIANLKPKDIRQAFKHSGMHRDVAHLYTIKTIKRRNNIVDLFDLKDEFAIYDTPDLENYSPNKYPTIINGKISVGAYEGKNLIPIRVRTWGSLISTLIAGKENYFISFSIGKTNNGIGQVFGNAIPIPYDWNKNKISFGPFGSGVLQPGIKIVPIRKVIESPQNLNTAKVGKHNELVRTNLPYMVIDQLLITVGVAAGAYGPLSIPVNISAGLQIAQKIISHRHFSSSVKNAWLSAYQIPQILFEGKEKFAAHKLRDLENIESYYSIGVDLDLKSQTQYVANGAVLGGSVRKFKHRLLYRDQFGKLHYFTDNAHKKSSYAGLYLGKFDLSLFYLAALDLGISKESFRGEINDYIVGGHSEIDSHDHALHTKKQALREIAALKKLKKSHQEDVDISLNFGRKFSGGSSRKTIGLGFLFAHDRLKNWGQIEDTFSDGQVRKLFQGTSYTGKHLGKKDIWDFNEVVDIAVKNGKSKKTIIEVDTRAPEKFIITVNSKVFTRKINRKSLLSIIKKLNIRYGENPKAIKEEQFFSTVKLPSKKEQNIYRKIYAEIKTQVDGEYLLDKIKNTDISELKELVNNFFTSDALFIKKEQVSTNYGASVKIDYISKKKKIIKHFRKIKKLLNTDYDQSGNWRSVWLESRDLVHELCSRYYGIQLLKDFLNINIDKEDMNKGLLVYGEIRNILDHISTLERPYGHNANLRNAGRHWGNFVYGKDKIRAVQYFLKYEDPSNKVPVYAPPIVSSKKILGRLEQGQPPNFSGEGI